MEKSKRILFSWAIISTIVSIARGNNGRPILHRKASSFRRQQQQRQETFLLTKVHHRNAQDLSLLYTIRGGADADEISIDTSSSSSSSLVMTKLRNIIRSILQIGERKAPSLTRTFRSVLKTIEKLLGVELLPKKKTKKKKKKASKGKAAGKKGSKTTTEDTTKSDSDDGDKVVKSKPNVVTTKHLNEKLTTTNKNYRIQKELKQFIKDPPPNLSVKVGKNIRVWIVTMVGAKNTIYEGEVYKLRISFPPQYPTVPPSVYFLPPNIPRHEHVYTNGDICLSLLGKDWRPTMTAQSIANSILSILSSAQTKSIPMDNAKHAQNKPGQYQEDWVYHDDNC